MVAYEQQSQDGLLIFDAKPSPDLPTQFRRMDSAFKRRGDKSLVETGLTRVRASASAQFTQAQLLALKKALPGELWIIDLRQEFHGFLAGDSISWHREQNAGVKGLSPTHFLSQEQAKLATLQDKPLTVYTVDQKQYGSISEATAHQRLGEVVETEQAVVNSIGAHYARFMIQDHHKPTEQEAKRFVEFLQQLPADAWLHFHCKGGKGRSTTFMVMMDILHNGKDVALEDIIERQWALGGSHLFKPLLEDKDQWKKQAALDRQVFIRDFYLKSL